MDSVREVQGLPSKGCCKALQGKGVLRIVLSRRFEWGFRRNGETCSRKSFSLNAFWVGSGKKRLLKAPKRTSDRLIIQFSYLVSSLLQLDPPSQIFFALWHNLSLEFVKHYPFMCGLLAWNRSIQCVVV